MSTPENAKQTHDVNQAVNRAAEILLPFLPARFLVAEILRSKGVLGISDKIEIERLIEDRIQERIESEREEAHEAGRQEAQEECEEEIAALKVDLNDIKEIGMRVRLRQREDVLILLKRYFPDLAGIRALFEGASS